MRGSLVVLENDESNFFNLWLSTRNKTKKKEEKKVLVFEVSPRDTMR